MKKILTMLFVMMMVLGMGTAVYAADDGEINITGAKPEQTYKIYRILDLESYDTTTGNYAYKANSTWKTFLESTEIKGVYVEFNGEYVTWKTGADAKTFAELALKYANDHAITDDRNKTTSATETEVNFANLQLGYYLVDSSVGALCSLTTTNNITNITEKNDIPTIDKKIIDSTGTNPVESSTASIGDTVKFKTTITAQPGAQNYVLHDKMSDVLELDSTSIAVKLHSTDVDAANYTLRTTGLTDGCAFEIEFGQSFCNTLVADDKIEVTYSAKFKESAIANTAYENETWLKYSDSGKTTHVKTTTKTFEVNVFKCTEDNNGLADVTFGLYSDSTCTTSIKLKQDTSRMASVVYYPDTTGEDSIKTIAGGKFTIKGLGEGTYYLKEIDAPKGYNKLTAPIEIKIANDGTITVTGAGATYTTTEITIVNKTGTVLPSTGGMGTTIMYIVGAALLIGSGVMLITKKNAK